MSTPSVMEHLIRPYYTVVNRTVVIRLAQMAKHSTTHKDMHTLRYRDTEVAKWCTAVTLYHLWVSYNVSKTSVCGVKGSDHVRS